MRRHLLVMGLVAAAGCSFEGARGSELMFDAGADALVEDAAVVMMDAPVRASACTGFKVIGGSSYLILPSAIQLNWADSFNRCAAIVGAHLATFETVEEVSLVATDLPVTTPMWTGIAQTPSSPTPYQGWVNIISNQPAATIPIGFPWRTGEPNDFGLPENNEENGAELQPGGIFDDGGLGRLSRALCECPLAP